MPVRGLTHSRQDRARKEPAGPRGRQRQAARKRLPYPPVLPQLIVRVSHTQSRPALLSDVYKLVQINFLSRQLLM